MTDGWERRVNDGVFLCLRCYRLYTIRMDKGSHMEDTIEITTNDAWCALRGQKLGHAVVILRGLGNIHPFRDGPVFSKAHTPSA